MIRRLLAHLPGLHLSRSGPQFGDAWPETGTADPHLEPDTRGMARLVEAIDATEMSDERLLADMLGYWEGLHHPGIPGDHQKCERGLDCLHAHAPGAVTRWLATPRGQELAHRLEGGQ